MTTSLKAGLQHSLRKLGIYHRLKQSWVYDAYWRVADPSLIQNRRREVEFYRNTLSGFPAGGLVFDIGANQGQKTDVFLRLGARVVSVDPDETNERILREKFLSYHVMKLPVTLVRKAVSEEVGKQTFWIDAPGSAKNTLSPKWVETLRQDEARFGQRLDFAGKTEVETTTLEEMIRVYGRPYFVKIDVEGYEPAVLRGLKSRVPFLSFEVNLPEFKAEGLECIQLLNRVDPASEFNYAPDCQRGLASGAWLSAADFTGIYEKIEEPTVEVFWRTQRS